ncbi:TPA: serine hydroxymethyltransferase [archaeon]|uniref:Serine hydroxymethyltransferase n=1 Tax=Candidatus Naiadarchaeum limnaeum TaxID=2756139 RepID=A0A832UMV1_9ARCH|nr:serine hydroxymethyltransferase [Candidatus Naiadarchaeales archaeon SRR2090153.bin1042]HIK00104.1 serine hydroxymethyltransferase [Candidatus Naiadarchaeum limnaeum]
MRTLREIDPDVYNAVVGEERRENTGLELIASENYVSKAVIEAMASVLTNKYSEGYPGKRYYGGQEFTDLVENLAIERAKKLFHAEHVNVQPLSGAPANIAVYFALLNPGDVVLGMDLGHGGHLTHGHPVTYMAKIFKFVRYKTHGTDGHFDFDEIRQIALKEKPKIILCGYSCYPRDLDYNAFQEIADEVGAYTMMDMAHIAGLIAAKEMNDPFKARFDVVTTTTHKTLRGPRGGMILSRTEDRYHDKYNKDSKKNLAQMIDSSVFPGFQGGPHMHQIAGKAVAFGEALKPDFKNYAAQIRKNAKAMAQRLIELGWTLFTGGTENHLMLADITKLGLTGKEAQNLLDEAGITLNKNAYPDDTRPPTDPSGIRIGTPAITTRGMKESEMKHIADLMDKVVRNPKDKKIIERVRKDVFDLTAKFPLYKLYK